MIDFSCSDHCLADLIRELRQNEILREQLFEAARSARDAIYGPVVFFRGLIEVSNVCRQDCYYCGIRKSQTNINRYRLTDESILDCCQVGYQAGYRTFVLQGGEDPGMKMDRLVALIERIRLRYPDCAITLSLGELRTIDYQRLFDAGANRYLLRHESADALHYAHLHPQKQLAENRIRYLYTLKRIGFQTGAGMMVGSPGQQTEHLVADLRFLQALSPHMVGIGPFMPAQGTPFSDHPAGTLTDTLILIALTRLMLPSALIPSTTALGSLTSQGRLHGLRAGANVLMPNISPSAHKRDYSLYDGKTLAGDDARKNRMQMTTIVHQAGMTIDDSRGDAKQAASSEPTIQ